MINNIDYIKSLLLSQSHAICFYIHFKKIWSFEFFFFQKWNFIPYEKEPLSIMKTKFSGREQSSVYWDISSSNPIMCVWSGQKGEKLGKKNMLFGDKVARGSRSHHIAALMKLRSLRSCLIETSFNNGGWYMTQSRRAVLCREQSISILNGIHKSLDGWLDRACLCSSAN